MNTENFLTNNNIDRSRLPHHLQAAITHLENIQAQWREMPDGESRNMVSDLILKSDDALLKQLKPHAAQRQKRPPKSTGEKGKYYYLKMPFVHLGDGKNPQDSINYHLNKLFVIRGYPVKFKRKDKDYSGKSMTALNDLFFVAKINDEFLNENNITKDAFFNMAENINACYNRWIVAAILTGEFYEYPHVKSESKHHKTKISTLMKFQTHLEVDPTLKRYNVDLTDQAISFLKELDNQNGVKKEVRRTVPNNAETIGYLPMYYSLITPEARYLQTLRYRIEIPE